MAHLSNPQESKTLWVGDIETWMDESYLGGIFASTGAVANVKVIRDKKTGASLGYGFVEFQNHRAAQEVLMKYNGSTIPGTNKKLKMNWGVMTATNKTSTTSAPTIGLPTANPKLMPTQPLQEHSIYVGELSSSVDENVLVEFFSQRYRTVTGAKIIVDPVTRQSKGYGFVKFSSAEEAQSAIREMQGILLRGRAIKTNQAHLKNAGNEQAGGMNASNLMLNPLLASLTANAIPTTGYMMGTDPSALAGYATQGLQGQLYQGNVMGMGGVSVMPQAITPGYAYPNMATMGAQNPQVYQAYQQPQMIGAYQPQQGQMMTGYVNPSLQMTAQPNPYYQHQQVGGFYAQPTAYQQYPGYGIQTQIVPNQQQQFVGAQQQSPYQYPQQNLQQQQQLPKQQSPLLNFPQVQNQNQGQKPPLLNLQALKPQTPNSKGLNGSPLDQNRVVNTLLPSKAGGIESLLVGLDILPPSKTNDDKKMEEEKPEDAMKYNPNYIEANFRFDFISSEKMKNII